MKKIRLILFFILSTLVVGTVSAQPPQCPRVIFNHFGNDSIECNTDGNVIIDLFICPDYVGAYELDSVVWNMGDGTIVSTNVLQINYSYASSSVFNVTAIAYFTINGSTCSTEAAVLYANSLCSNINAFPSSFWHYGASIAVLNLSADLYASTASVGAIIYPNTPVSLKLDHQGINPLYSLTYQLLIDGVEVVPEGTNVATSGANVYPATTYPIGQHVAEIVLYSKANHYCPKVLTTTFEVVAPPDSLTNCSECFTFRPDHTKRYWISAWVKEEVLSQVKTYTNTSLKVRFLNNLTAISTTTLSPTGEIIDGWQRIAGEFTVPINTTSIDVKLDNVGTVAAYFDDIRIHPFNASMKSYVNDAETFWLVAELDDNNYATFYEYDKEGQLIRIKKETAKGIMTIQESRSSNPKN